MNVIPQSKLILSLSRVRLASTKGHVAIIEPGVPTRIPQALFLEAAKCGCVDYNPRMVQAFKTAMENAAAAETPESMVDIDQLAKDAVRQVLLAAKETPELLTSTGLPRVPAVRVAFEDLCAQNGIKSDVKVTTELVQDYFLRVQEEAEARQIPPRGAMSLDEVLPPQGDLEGEEVGGDIEEVLARVADTEE